MHTFGATKKPLILLEERQDLIRKRPSFPLTGTHRSPGSASVWRSVTTSPNLLLSTSGRTPCTLWSLMGNTAAPHLVVKRGSRWLVLRPPCKTTVTGKDLTPRVTREKDSKARIGILFNNENECESCDSRIGFGTGGYPDDSNTCGNEALAEYEADNGNKHIKAMGYILVQWKQNNTEETYVFHMPCVFIHREIGLFISLYTSYELQFVYQP